MASTVRQHIHKHIRPHLPIIGILILGALLRLPQLDQVPNGFYCDEAAIGYDAYAILKTGRDHWGEFLPLFARSFGDYDEATYRYLAVPTIYFFGLNEFATRLPAALTGIATIWALFFFCQQLFGKRTALWMALFLAISPWHIMLSRWAVRAILLPLFFCLGLGTFLKGSQKPKHFILSALCFGISLHTYNAARVFIPLFILGLVWIYRKTLWQHRRHTLPAALLFLVILGYLTTFWISPHGMQRAESTLTTDLTALPGQYLSYFHPRFLFWRGDDNPRHSMLPMGQLHYIEAITVFIGLFGFIKQPRKNHKILYLLFFLYPIPAALTASTHAIRAVMGTSLFAILSGYGMHTLYTYFQNRKHIVSFVSTISIATSLITFHTFYFVDYAGYSAYWWQYGIGEGIKKAEEYPYPCQIEPTKPYSLLYIFVLFYTQFPPEDYHAQPQHRKEGNWQGVPLGKYTIKILPDKNTAGPHLYLAGQNLYSELAKTKREIYDLHTIEDPSGRGILLKLLMTDAPSP